MADGDLRGDKNGQESQNLILLSFKIELPAQSKAIWPDWNPRNVSGRPTALSTFTRQRRSTSAESTAQINILIQKLGLEVLCFISTLTLHCCDCVSVSCPVARVLFWDQSWWGRFIRELRDGERPPCDANQVERIWACEHIRTSTLTEALHDRDRHLPIGYLPLSARPRASAHQCPPPPCPAGTATSSPAWRKASVRFLFASQVEGSFWRMSHFHLPCESVYLQEQTLQCPQGKKAGMHL